MQLPPQDVVITALRETVGPPFVLSLIVVALARLLGRRAVVWAAPLVLIGSLAVGNYYSQINPDWWPVVEGVKRISWLPWLVLGGCVAGLVQSGLKWRTLGHILWAITLAFCIVRVLPKDYYTEPLWLLPVFVATLGLQAFGLQALHERFPGITVPLIAAAALHVAGLVLIHAHTKSLMDVVLHGSFSLLGIGLVLAFTKGNASSVYPGVAFLLTGTLFAGYHETYSEVPMAAFIIPAGAPLLALIGLVPGFERLKPWLRVLLLLLPVLIALGVAVGLAASYEEISFGEEEPW